MQQLKNTESSREFCEPVLRWAGGKRWAVAKIMQHLPSDVNHLFEPFAGGAALFFHSSPRTATLSDTNGDLINAYLCLRDNLSDVIDVLKKWENSENTYYKVRDLKKISKIERAARLIYLCRHSFNGIYRVNMKGDFNVPYGQKHWRSTFDEEALIRANLVLKKATLQHCDFQQVLAKPKKGDVVYADPPYTVAHNNNGFVKYNEKIFSFSDQERLAFECKRLASEGVIVLVSNADHASIKALYDGSIFHVIERSSVISADSAFRRRITELLIEVKP